MSLRPYSAAAFEVSFRRCRIARALVAAASTAMLVLLAVALTVVPAAATDVDGGPDCPRQIRDFGDAPEGVPAYPFVLGAFPTCLAPGPVATQTLACPPPLPVPVPGPAGFVLHLQFGQPPNYWLGCYPGPIGIDTEFDGKTNAPAIGVSACSEIPTDCIEPAFGLTFDQDECFGDGSDTGVLVPTLIACQTGAITFITTNCAQQRQVFLNICLDMNTDGDWTDSFLCAGACANEWAVANFPLILPPGCTTFTSPGFLVGPTPGTGWLRVSISDTPMPADYPWNGTAGTAMGAVQGGETEDYPVYIDDHVGVEPRDWGGVKSIYR